MVNQGLFWKKLGMAKTSVTKYLWLISFTGIFFVMMSCPDTGIFRAIEDAKDLEDGNLSNNLFIHSLVEIKGTVYAGSKYVWQKTSSSGSWSKISLPSNLDPNKTPVVSIATDGTNLFVASSERVYVRLGNSWSSTIFLDGGSKGFLFYSLRAVPASTAFPSGVVLAVNKENTIYSFDAGTMTWSEVRKNTKMNGLAEFGSNLYLASGEKIMTGANPSNLAPMSGTLNGSEEITSILAGELSTGAKYLAIIADGKFYTYDGTKWYSRGSNSAINISMVQLGDKLLIGRFAKGYHLYDLAGQSWLASGYNGDGLTDVDSLVTLASGRSIIDLSLGIFLLHKEANVNNDRLYATTLSSHGLFSGARKGRFLLSWQLE